MANKKKSSNAKIKKASVKTAVKTANKVTTNSLYKWNIVLSAVLGLQAVAILVLSETVKLPIVLNFLNKDALASQVAGSNVLVPAARHLWDINVAWLVAAFLLVAAAAHGAVATIHRKSYEEGLAKRVNKRRWVNYAVGASLAMITISLINGIYDVASLLMIAGLVVLLHGLAYKNELVNNDAKQIKWLNFKGVLVAGGAVWLALDTYVKGAAVYGVGLPKYVYWLDTVTFILLLAIAANIWLTTKQRGKWANYLYSELVYIILGFTLVTTLAWQIFFGLLQ